MLVASTRGMMFQYIIPIIVDAGAGYVIYMTLHRRKHGGSWRHMIKEKNYPHGITVNTTMCKFCMQPQCDLCVKEYLAFHIVKNYKELRMEDMG